MLRFGCGWLLGDFVWEREALVFFKFCVCKGQWSVLCTVSIGLHCFLIIKVSYRRRFLGAFENENCCRCYLCFDLVKYWLIVAWYRLVNENDSNQFLLLYWHVYVCRTRVCLDKNDVQSSYRGVRSMGLGLENIQPRRKHVANIFVESVRMPLLLGRQSYFWKWTFK